MKRFLTILLVLMLALSTLACGQTGITPGKTSSSESSLSETSVSTETEASPTDYIFTDSLGRELTVPAEISKIVPSGPLAQIILFAIAPEMFVGLASNWDDVAEGIIPAEYYNLPYFGQLYSSADLNVEELAAAGPELIIDIGKAKKSTVEDLDNLQAQTNIPAVFISASLETMPETFRTLGSLLGKEEKGEELAQFCERVYNRTLSIMNEVGENKIDALIIGGEEGLNVLAKGSYHAEIMDILTNNIAVVDNPSSKGLGNAVDMEQIMLWNPEFIIFMPESIYSTAADMTTWKELDAIASGNYVEVPNGPHNWMGMPPSVQRFLGMIWLTAVLYPEHCDYDVKTEVLEYYRLFYSCELSDAQYDALTENAFIK